MTPTSAVDVAEERQQSGREQRIANWSQTYGMSPDEVLRIRSTLDEPDEEIDAAMLEELHGVLAARRIARMKEPTAESMKAIGVAFNEGRLPVKSLPVD